MLYLVVFIAVVVLLVLVDISYSLKQKARFEAKQDDLRYGCKVSSLGSKLK